MMVHRNVLRNRFGEETVWTGYKFPGTDRNNRRTCSPYCHGYDASV